MSLIELLMVTILYFLKLLNTLGKQYLKIGLPFYHTG